MLEFAMPLLQQVRLATTLALIAPLLMACADAPAPPAELGPRDGAELAPVDPDRVAVGDTAPDFSLRSHGGEIVTLSDFRGRRDILLVFYRGHW